MDRAPGRGKRSEAYERQRTVCACLPSAAILSQFNSMKDPLYNRPLHLWGGRPGTDHNIEEGRGPRRLKTENSPRMSAVRKAIVPHFNSMIPSPATLSSHPLHSRGGRLGTDRHLTDRHLEKGRGPRRLSNIGKSTHVCGPIGDRPAFQQSF